MAGENFIALESTSQEIKGIVGSTNKYWYSTISLTYGNA